VATCHFQSGRAEKALPLLQQTTAFYQKARDKQGFAADMGVLFEVYRYLGQGAEAAVAAKDFAWALDHTGGKTQADRLWKVANVIQRGEPLNRVVVDFMGATHELDALPVHVKVSLRFSFCRNRTELARATARVQRGRELSQEGRFEEALALFTEAGRFDIHSPEPRYEGAETLLHLQRASESVAWYDEVEALAPGWYACRARRWLAAGIAAGRIPHAAFLLLRELEKPNLSAEEGVELARRALREAPGVPELQWHLGRHLVALGLEEEARQVFAEGLARAEEPDVRSRLLIELAALLPASEGRDERLREALAPGGHLIAAAMAGVMLRTGPSQRPDPRRADSTVVVHKRHLTREELELLAKYELDEQPVPAEHRDMGRHLDVCEACSKDYSLLIPPQWLR
jgi:tetratricopeptide (TPR) repeat protein